MGRNGNGDLVVLNEGVISNEVGGTDESSDCGSDDCNTRGGGKMNASAEAQVETRVQSGDRDSDVEYDPDTDLWDFLVLYSLEFLTD